MRIILCAFQPELKAAWDQVLQGCGAHCTPGHSLETTAGDITALTVTAVVSPANSAGVMRGGVDLAYTLFFGEGLEHDLQARIQQLPGNTLPVGSALVIPTGHSRIPYLVSAPTMVRPMRLAGPDPVRLACRAATTAAMEQGFADLAFPGMGTGTGGLSMPVAALAMLEGIAEGLGLPPGQA